MTADPPTTLRAASVQMRLREDVPAAVDAMRALVTDAAANDAELVLLPEYWFAPDGDPATVMPGTADHAKRLVDALADASRESGVVVAGNVLHADTGGYWNTVHVMDDGRELGAQSKIHPMPGEAAMGVRGATALAAFHTRHVRTGVLVCADVMYPEVSRILSLQRADLLLNPVMSPYKEEDVTKDARDALFIARAWDAAAFVLKAGTFSGTSRRAVGRSLIAAPWGILARYKNEWAEETLIADLDLAKLRAFRESHRGFADRRPDAYKDIVAHDH